MNDEHPSIFDAMQAFDSLSGAVAFTPNEIALFYVILSSWNAARRPAVLQQWAITTCARCGLNEKHSLPDARNGLVQKRVIFFKKHGNRGVPQYSLNALFEIEEPQWLPPKYGSKHGSKRGSNRGVSTGVNPDSYQSKEKEEEKESPLTPETLNREPSLNEETGSGFDRSAIPELEQAKRYSLSSGLPIALDCVEAWHDSRIASGWTRPQGGNSVPIADWRADLRGFSRSWQANRVDKIEEKRKLANERSPL